MLSSALDVVWGDPSGDIVIPQRTSLLPPESPRDAISAKKSVIEAETKEPAVDMSRALKLNETQVDVVISILSEIRHLRKEQTHRCTTYLIVAAILFAMLFMYIDRLHSQVHRLRRQQLAFDNASVSRMQPQPF